MEGRERNEIRNQTVVIHMQIRMKGNRERNDERERKKHKNEKRILQGK